MIKLSYGNIEFLHDTSYVYVIMLLSILLGIYFGFQTFIISLYILTIVYLITVNDKILLRNIVIGSIIAFTWAFLGRAEYGYNNPGFIIFFGVNLFPFFGFSVGSFSAYITYYKFNEYLKIKGTFLKFILFTVVSWSLLVIFETLGYHLFNVHNDATAMYPGLPICDCMHAPTWMKIIYFSLPLLYYIVCEIVHRIVDKRKD